MSQKIKQEFARKLQKAMLDKGWNQSELARRAGMGRDNISGYMSGRILPGSKHLKKLEDALSQQLIEGVVLRDEPDTPMLEIKQHDDGMVVIRMVQIVPMSVAMEIMELLKEKK
jgi:transcriptional regulator with XRE-family HTH domain